MMYSVWNQGQLKYDYFDTPETQETANSPAPKHLRRRVLGSTPTQSAWPLPLMARPVGSGDYPIGKIAVDKGRASSLGESDIETAKTVGAIVALAIAWHFSPWRKR